MIKFKTRQVGLYMNLIIKVGNMEVDLGLQDQEEIEVILDDLHEGINEISKYKEYEGENDS